MFKKLIGLGLEIGAGDVNLSAEVSGGDSRRQFVGALVIIFGNLTMAFLVFGDVRSYDVGHPDGDVQLQVHLDMCDGQGGVRGVGLASLSCDNSVG